MKNPSPIVVSGSIAIDRIMNFTGRYKDHINAEKLDSLSISIFLNQLQDAHGGVGANIAYTLALLGDEPFLLGSVGKDGLLYMEKLAHHGVNIAHIHESNLPTASFNVITDDDQNQVGGFYPGAMFDSDNLSFEPWKDQDPIVVISPHDPKAMHRQVKQARTLSLRMCYDIGQQVSNLPGDQMLAGLEAAEILIVNDYEMTILSEKTGKTIADIKASTPIVITTLGKNGSVIEGMAVEHPIKVGIAQPKTQADPTGAGDAYRAGFLYGYSRGWPLKTSAQLGALCGAYALEHPGTQSHQFTYHEAAARYKENFNETLPG